MGERDERRPNPSSSPEPRIARRALVAGGLGGVVATALTRLSAQTAHAEGEYPQPNPPLLLGTDNVAIGTTGLFQEGAGPTLQVENLDGGAGIQVHAGQGLGVYAHSYTAGVLGTGGPLPAANPITETLTATMPGVAGASAKVGVLGAALPNAGTITVTQPAQVGVPVGVWGSAGNLSAGTILTHTKDVTLPGVGVWGSAPALPHTSSFTYTVQASAGVLGTAFGAGQTAVLAHNPGGTALHVDGGIRVNCGGRGVIPRLSRDVWISDPTLQANSLVAVTLTGDPGNQGTALHHVEVETGRLRVVLTGTPNRDVPFTYLCLELA